MDAPENRKFFLNPSVCTTASTDVVPDSRGTGSCVAGAHLATLTMRVETSDTFRLRRKHVERAKQRAAFKGNTQTPSESDGDSEVEVVEEKAREVRHVRAGSAAALRCARSGVPVHYTSTGDASTCRTCAAAASTRRAASGGQQKRGRTSSTRAATAAAAKQAQTKRRRMLAKLK